MLLNLLSPDFSEIAGAMSPNELFRFGNLIITDRMFFSSVLILVIILCAALIRIFVIPRFTLVGKGFQCILEWVVDTFDKMAEETTKPFAKFLGPYTFGAAVFICFGILIELFGIKSPISDINACVALSLMTFVLINFYGLKSHGAVGRIKYYFKPTAIVGPFRMVSDLFVPVSMSLRLFGAAVSGLITMEFIYIVCPYVLPAAASVIFTIFHAFIQAYVFSILTLLFIAEAAE